MDEGQLFRKLRKDRGLSLEQVSDELNSVSFISKFEKGNSNISMHRLERLLENVNVSFEEFLYLRQLNQNPNLNEELKVLRGYLTSDFYFLLADLMRVVSDINKSGFKKGIEEMTEIREKLNPKVSWQNYLIIYCDVCLFTYESNLDESKRKTVESIMENINLITKPIVSYLYKVEDWGLFEVLLFRLFLFSFKESQIKQLLTIALSRTKKESQLPVMATYKLDIVFSSFSHFVNFRNKEWAKETLILARNLLKDEKDLMNSTFLLFYEGWYTIIFEEKEKGLQSCHQALSIFRILDQPSLENKFQIILKSVLKNKEEPSQYLLFV